MADRIELTGVVAYGHHGVLDSEKAQGQTFSVDIVCWLNTADAARDDDLTKTLNYAELAELAHGIVTGPPRDLIETVAGEIAEEILSRYELPHAVEVTVHKPHAPIAVPFDDVAIVARRSRKDHPRFRNA